MTEMRLRALGLTLVICALAVVAMKRAADVQESPARDQIAAKASPTRKAWRPADSEPSPFFQPTKHRPAREKVADRSTVDQTQALQEPAEDPAGVNSRLEAVAPEDRGRLGQLLKDAVATEDAADDREVMRELHRLSVERATAAAENASQEDPESENP